MADGRLNKCKRCTRKDVSANRAAKVEYYRNFDRKRGNAPHRVAARRAYADSERGRTVRATVSARWIDRNPIKRSAHIAVQSAKRSGALVSRPCRDCGIPDAQAHHSDYTKPLDVVWLCPTHHAAEHRRSNDARAAYVY